MPPTMVAMKAKRTTLTPRVGETVPVCAVRRTAATPASRPESANANAITVSARTPRIRAIRKSSAAARICLPMDVPRRSEPRQSSEASVTPTMTTSSFWIESEPTSTVSPRAAAKSVDRGVDPHVSAATFWSRKLSAKDVISRVAGLALRTGRKATRSMASASATTITSATGIRRGSENGSRTSANAPTMTSSPWAKLIRRMIPKMSAIPSAKRA